MLGGAVKEELTLTIEWPSLRCYLSYHIMGLITTLLFIGFILMWISIGFLIFGFLGYFILLHISFPKAFDYNYDIITAIIDPSSFSYPVNVYAFVDGYFSIFFLPLLGGAIYGNWRALRNEGTKWEQDQAKNIKDEKEQLDSRILKMEEKTGYKYEISEKKKNSLAEKSVYIRAWVEKEMMKERN